MPAVVPELADQCVIVNGVAKTYAMTGWRVGWMIGPGDVVKAAVELPVAPCRRTSPTSSQRAALAAVSGPMDVVEEMRAAFDLRRQQIVDAVRRSPDVECPNPAGGVLRLPSVKAVLGKKMRGQRPTDTLELADLILREAEVAVVPGEAFGTPGYFRFSYALAEEDLVEGVTRVANLLSEAKD